MDTSYTGKAYQDSLVELYLDDLLREVNERINPFE